MIGIVMCKRKLSNHKERSAAKPQPKELNKLNALKELNEKKGGWNFVAACEQVGLLQCKERRDQDCDGAWWCKTLGFTSLESASW